MTKQPAPPPPAGGRLLRKPRAPAKPHPLTDTQPKPEDTVIVPGYAAAIPRLPESPPPPQMLPWGNSFTYEYVMAMAYPGHIGEATQDPLHGEDRIILNTKESTRASQERFADGYRDYTYIAGASPPPPSEFSLSPTKTDLAESSFLPSSAQPGPQRGEAGETDPLRANKAPRSRNRTAGSKEAKYMIDPIHRQRTNLGTYVEGQSLLKHYRTRGPDPLPVRAPAVRQPQVVHVLPEGEEEARYFEPPEFTLQDFMIKVAETEQVPMHRVEQIVYSRHNYKKLQKLLADVVIHPRIQKSIRPIHVEMPPELSKLTPRVPQKQLVVEMAALIKEQMSAVMNTEMRPVIKPLPKWSPDYKPGVPRPHTEIVLYEGNTPHRRNTRDNTEISIKIQPEAAFNTSDSLFHSSTARYFQGSRRSNSPFGESVYSVRSHYPVSLSASDITVRRLVPPPGSQSDRSHPASGNQYNSYAANPIASIYSANSGGAGSHSGSGDVGASAGSYVNMALWRGGLAGNPEVEGSSPVKIQPLHLQYSGQHSPEKHLQMHPPSRVRKWRGVKRQASKDTSPDYFQTNPLAGVKALSAGAGLGSSWDHHPPLPQITEGYITRDDQEPVGGSGREWTKGGSGREWTEGGSRREWTEGGSGREYISSEWTTFPRELSRDSELYNYERQFSFYKQQADIAEGYAHEEADTATASIYVDETERTFLSSKTSFLSRVKTGERQVLNAPHGAQYSYLPETTDDASKPRFDSVPKPSQRQMSQVFGKGCWESPTLDSRGSKDVGAPESKWEVGVIENPLPSREAGAEESDRKRIKQPEPLGERERSVVDKKREVEAEQEAVLMEQHQQLEALRSFVVEESGAVHREDTAAAAEEGMISPSELAILDTLISGGSALSLKAHFISDMPDIEPLLKTITYLNLSFNDFRSVPYEIFEIENLTVLKLRNNPIRDIPPEISKLKHLKTLVFSFCLVSTLPVALFSLRKLEHLDVAYNRISFIPSEIKHLKRLHELNVEGNQLPAMPVGLMRLRSLRYLRVRNNFMHPLFWKDNAKNEPQSLTYMAALVLKQYNLQDQCEGRVPKPLLDMIDSPAKCDCCRGPLYGPGLRMIRPVSRIFGIKNLPFMFRSCSPYCLSNFANSTENMVELLYGTPSEEQVG